MLTCLDIKKEQVKVCGDNMKEFLIYGAIYLVLVYIFLLFVLRAIYFTFVLKDDTLKSVKIKISKPTGLFKRYKEEEKQDKNSKWG